MFVGNRVGRWLLPAVLLAGAVTASLVSPVSAESSEPASITVVKQLVPADGAVDAATAPTDGWTFSATTSVEGATVTPGTGTTSPGTGALRFDVALPDS